MMPLRPVQLPVENGEDLQILRYEHGQKYDEVRNCASYKICLVYEL